MILRPAPSGAVTRITPRGWSEKLATRASALSSVASTLRASP